MSVVVTEVERAASMSIGSTVEITGEVRSALLRGRRLVRCLSEASYARKHREHAPTPRSRRQQSLKAVERTAAQPAFVAAVSVSISPVNAAESRNEFVPPLSHAEDVGHQKQP
mmetsp:Transcript_4104/g.11282  ORF Transcript_4104/g.11282 Transcript_4104/m.11282 type:complete len:113 (-) Transcript_4104:268-606(-)